MNPPTVIVPVLPESAPFTPEQRAYLNGFLAGLFSYAPVPTANAAPAAKPLEPLAILFGSQTGNAENLAKRIAKEAGKHGFAPTIHDLAKFPAAQLAAERNLLLITSTYGDGEPPDNAKGFWDFLNSETAPALANTRFSVCALGDSNYPKFCQFGKDVDTRLEKLGATRVQPRQDCDVELEEPFTKWLLAALPALAWNEAANVESIQPSALGVQPDSTLTDGYSRSNPFPARLLTNRPLNAPGSGKDVRHFEIALEGSGLAYEVGDALGVLPSNDPALVEELLRALGCDGEDGVPGKDGTTVPLRFALLNHYNITRIPQPFLAAVAGKTGDAVLKQLVAPGVNGELTKFLFGREIIDVLLAQPQARFSAAEFIGTLKKLQPRLYSISSSPKAHPGQVHLTVGAVRYESLGRQRAGVCSTFLADRVAADTPVPVFVHTNKAFRPPAPDAPLIMVGPGTGIAPFRAFLEERKA
ncbi:MAG TPA: flavodoxin domain-containing protein, partial [Verrucomicrobiae bacterium]